MRALGRMLGCASLVAIGACEFGEPDESYFETDLLRTTLDSATPQIFDLLIAVEIEDPETIGLFLELVVDRHSAPTVTAGFVDFVCPSPFETIAGDNLGDETPVKIHGGKIWRARSLQDAPFAPICTVSFSGGVHDEPIDVFWRARVTTEQSRGNGVEIELEITPR